MTKFKEGIWICGIGLCFGWLIGLSESPVISIVISSLIGLTVGFIAVKAGFKSLQDELVSLINNQGENKVSRRINFLPLFLFTISMVASGTLALKLKNTRNFLKGDLIEDVEHIYQSLKINSSEIPYFIPSNSSDTDSLVVLKYNAILRYEIRKALVEQRYHLKMNCLTKVDVAPKVRSFESNNVSNENKYNEEYSTYNNLNLFRNDNSGILIEIDDILFEHDSTSRKMRASDSRIDIIRKLAFNASDNQIIEFLNNLKSYIKK